MTSIKEGATGLAAGCLAEVADLHRFFEAWLNGGGAAAGFDRCERALGDGFAIVDSAGALCERGPLLSALRAAHGRHAGADEPFRIWIERPTVRMVHDPVCLVTYEEWQRIGGRTTARLSSALFRRRPDGPNGVEWLHVHETWLPGDRATR